MEGEVPAEFIIARNLITADTAMMPRMTREERRRLVIELCEKDEYQLILLLDEGYEITAADVEHIDARQMLGYACVNGNLELAVWLANRFEFGAQDVVDIHLERVCSNGHARILGWLTDRFHLTAKYIRTRSMLFNACLSGDLDFVRWLVGRFGLTARDAREDHHRLLRHVCMSGRAQVTAWIVAHFGLGRPGSDLSSAIMAQHVYARVDSEEKYLRAIAWIEQMRPIRLGPRKCRRIIQYAVDNKYLNVIRWMAQRYGLTQTDMLVWLARGNMLPWLTWFKRSWLSAQNAVWTETGDVVAAQWPAGITSMLLAPNGAE